MFTALLGSIDLFHEIKLHSLKLPPHYAINAGIALQPFMLFIILAYFTQASSYSQELNQMLWHLQQ